MAGEADIRPGEAAIEPPAAGDAGLVFIGRIRTPWPSRRDTPRQGQPDGPICRLEVFAAWAPALAGLERFAELDVLYWLHLSRRDLVLQCPKHDGVAHGTFSLRSPVRPNPIGVSRVRLCGVEGAVVSVRGLDCVDGTPLIDIKPNRCGFSPRGHDQQGGR